ncbi:unnamed protein product [Diamesa tonsa]
MTVIVTEKKVAPHSQAMSGVVSSLRKTGAVRNLFGTKVDNRELQNQIDQLEQNNSESLDNYKCESVIGIIVFSNSKRKRSRTLNISRISPIENLDDLGVGIERNTEYPLLEEQVTDDPYDNRNVPELSESQMNKPEQSVEVLHFDSSKIKPTKKLVGQTTLKGTKHFCSQKSAY